MTCVVIHLDSGYNIQTNVRKKVITMNKANYPNEEEITLVRESILLPMLLTIVENNKRELTMNQMPLKQLYLNITEVLLRRIFADITQVRKELSQRNIKVVEDDQKTASLQYVMYVRGYEEKFGIMKELVKAELGIKLGKYVGQLTKDLTVR